MKTKNKSKLSNNTRRAKLNRKVAKAATVFLSGMILLLVAIFLDQKGIHGFGTTILFMIGPLGEILGVCMFASSVHDPVDYDEARELSQREEREKSGENSDIFF